jgi:phosphoadenosine phosphosulfate reductase
VLIITPRHTPEDLKLWAEYEEIDSIIKVSQAKIDRSIAVIKGWLSTHKPCYIGTSWGKDSVVMLHLFCLTGLKAPVVYVRYTDRDNPDCELVRDDFLKKYDIDSLEEVFEYAKTHNTGAHWRSVAQKYGQYRITGIRNDESGIRRMIYRMYGEESKNSCRPLSLWTNKEIFAYIEQQGLPLAPMYGYLGGGRWPREHLRTHSLAGETGDNFGRTEWEREYYPDILAKIQAGVV